MKNFYEKLLEEVVSNALKYKRTISIGIYKVVKQGKIYILYDTDFYMGDITLERKDNIVLSFNMVAKQWQKDIVESAIQNQFGIKFIKS
jgi:hypothetical protein